METDFQIRVGEFEGPLETLLDLIEKRKLHINDISLAEVADAFIEHIKVVLIHYPANVEINDDYLILKPSSPHIKRLEKR